MATAQESHALVSHYIKQYKNKYDHEPVVNRHTARWGFDSLLRGMSPVQARELVDFYLTTYSSNRHSLDWFFYNYDKLIESQATQKEDAERRERLRSESAKRAKEWRERGNTGITSN